MIGHDDPRHGSDRGYRAGCHQACCRAAHTEWMRAWRADDGPRLFDSAATVRRVEALACRGWSLMGLAQRLGRQRTYLQGLGSRRLQRSTVEKVAALYEELRDVTCLDPTADRVALEARARGAIAPEGWVDIGLGILAAALLAEKVCGCHLYMPDVRTLAGLECLGCGWGWRSA